MAAGGLSAERLITALRQAFCRFDVVAVAVSAYEPQADRDGRMRLTAHRLLGVIGTLAMRHYRR